MLAPPLDFNLLRGQAKPVLVLFEQKQCTARDELHAEALARSETKALMENFHVA